MAGKSKAIGEELYNKCNLELKKHGIRNEKLKNKMKGQKIRVIVLTLAN